MIERRGLQDQSAGEAVRLAGLFAHHGKADPLALGQLVGHHLRNRLRLEQGLAARQQASDQRDHVGQRRNQAAAAIEPCDRAQIGAGEGRVVGSGQARLHRLHQVGAGVIGDEPALILFRHDEAGIDHAERIENPRLDEFVKALAADDLDQPRHDVGGERIFPGRAGMIDQRQAGQHVHHVGQRRHGIVHAALVEGLEDGGARIEKAVAQPGAVAQELADGDRALRRLGVIERRCARAQDFSISELRNEFLDRVIEPEFAFLEQQQRRAGGDQLGVGEDAEDMVGAERRLRFLVGPADAIHVDEVAPDHDRPGNAGQQVAVDIALHGRLRRFEVVTVGGHFQVFHCRSLCRRFALLLSSSLRTQGPITTGAACSRR